MRTATIDALAARLTALRALLAVSLGLLLLGLLASGLC